MAPTPQPSPLDGHQGMQNALAPLGGNSPNSPNSVSLAVLIDSIIQRTYHELTVLAELLPRKTDMERKIEIFQFASRTRLLFIRLLALVKWANSVSKVNKSASIMNFLDKQAMLFVDTANSLSTMARETLVNARLPNFHLPAAVEILTTGTYSRLPTCIRDRIIPPDPITAAEKRSTLVKLNQVIEHRLVTSSLPPQMKKLLIENGRVKFTVDHEFEATLTLMGDGPNIPWRLLDIDILVEDKETGNGRALVHPLQIHYIHQLLQTRLVDCSTPLAELYSVLHTFSEALQLEVLHSQTMRLCQDRLGDSIRVEEYAPAKVLTISYWKEFATRQLKSEGGYRISLQVDGHDPGRPLQVVHNPPLSSKDSELAEQAIRSDQLSVEKILVHTIHIRAKTRLMELKQELQQKLGPDVECVVQGSPAVLHLPILSPCLRSEHLLITVDMHSGSLQAHIPQDDPPAPLMTELQQTLNGDKSKFETVVSELKFWINQRRCEKTLQHLPVSVYERLPLLFAQDSPMAKMAKHKLFLRLHKHPNTLIVVEFKEKGKEIDFSCYMVVVKPASIEETAPDGSALELPKMYLKVQSVTELDAFSLTHGSFTSVDSQETLAGKRKALTIGQSTVKADGPGPSKKVKHPAYVIPDLCHIVALADERIPFAALAAELTRRNILHEGPTVETQGTSLVLKIIRLPDVEGVVRRALLSINRDLLSAAVRVQVKGTRSWILELVFHGSPVPSTSIWEQGKRLPIHFHYEMLPSEDIAKTVDALLQDWSHVVHLYAAVLDLGRMVKDEKLGYGRALSVKKFNYKKVVLAYGPGRAALATVAWKAADKKYVLALGSTGNMGPNAHSIVREQLEYFVNQHKSVAYLAKVLHETYEPVAAIAKLPTIPQMGAVSGRPSVPVGTFTVTPQSPTHIRLAYLNLYCLDIRFRSDGFVSIRDGAFSLFDKSKVIEEFSPTQGLKAFLSKYVDETAVSRRRSQSEDDNPPSPVTLEHSDSHFLSHAKSGSVGSPAQPRSFHASMTPPTGGNPLTPASPHMSGMSQQHAPPFGSSPATSSFSLSSPPSLPTAVNPSPSMLPHPSPGPGNAFGVGNSPLHAQSPASMLPTPSPNPAATPGGSFLGSGSHGLVDNSPFPSGSLASPAPNTWPGSPGMPRPSPARPGQSPATQQGMLVDPNKPASRVLPPRSWAGAIPTLLTHEAFDALCTPTALPGEEEDGTGRKPVSPLERFLGCVYMRRHLQRVIQAEECLTAVPVAEPGSIHFRCESLQGRVTVNPQHLQSLQLKLSPALEYKDQWNGEDIQILERFFESRVMAPNFKPNSILAFGRLLNAPFRILRDLVQIMRLELMPALAQQQQLKWNVQLCLTVPPSAPSIVPIGMAAVLLARSKVLFFLYIRRIGYPLETEGASLVLPLVYDLSSNVTQLAERREAAGSSMGPGGGNATMAAASQMLNRFAKFGHSLGLQPGECSVFPAVRDLLTNLTLPSEPQPQQQMNPVMQQPAMGVDGMMGMSNNPGMQMQGGLGMAMQQPQQQMQQQPQGQVPMPMQSPFGQGGMGQNTMGSMPMNNMGGPMGPMGPGGGGMM